MSDRARWSRRDTLACGILTAIAACGARRVVAETVAGALPDGGLLSALFPELGQAGTLSRACLRFFPASISADRLYAWIVPADRPELENAPTIAELRRSIGQRVRRDFAVDDTVQVDGWVLSLTELRLYALAALIAPATITLTESG
jgi:hypothetical protein